MDDVTFYAYRDWGSKEQIFITINCKDKSFTTNKNQRKYKSSKYGFSCYELKDYFELQDLEECLIYQGFKQEPLEEDK